ncbi:MAG: hypothetical protein ACLFTT_00620 [Candidatus Hydrogenedentota bacterium]
MQHNTRYIVWAAIALLATTGAWAHKPLVINGGPTDIDTAIVVDDVDVSQVAYHRIAESQPELWLTFEAAAGDLLKLQMGVPEITRLAEYRPAMALVGPGLPAADVPFDIPEDYGALVFPATAEAPVLFDEEFTGTTSWQWPMQEVTAETAGRYYLVAYHPNAAPGKLWVAVGEAEQFGIMDIVTLPRTVVKVRQFHEIFPWGGILGWGFLALLVVLLGLVLVPFL